MKTYDHKTVEAKWQKYWLENKTFATQLDTSKPKYYALDMFPFPSGAGLHVGHPVGYIATDIMSRKKRHEGHNVLHPMGWDAFGLPAENYAIKTGIHPSKATTDNINNFRRQIQSIGFSYDWDREVDTTDEKYYRWTQWLFLQFYKRGLLYEDEKPMNWCPKCKVVVANEEVEEGKHERCGHDVDKKNLRQWMFKITDYAERLLDDLDELDDWSEKIKAMQRNWIGKSQGVNFKNKVKGMDIEFEVYNSVPQTYYAETFTGIAPEHSMVYELVKGTDKEEEVMAFVERIKKKKLEKKFDIENDLEGIFTGRYVENFAGTGHDLEIWVASYILADYGTGIVNCSAHDERDFAFAKAHNIPLRPTMFPEDPNEAEKVRNLEYAYIRDPQGIMEICPPEFKGRKWGEVREDIIDYVVEQGYATRQVNYKLRDWIFTRQRYWGEPIPLVFDEEGKCYPLAESELPLVLPKTPNYEPSETGESPLAKISDWVNVEGYITDEGTVITSQIVPEGKKLQKFRRETSTMPNWAGSNWYWLRYMDANNEQEFCSKEAENYFGPVDLYVGGAEHAVLHLLYSRFWHKVLFDMGLVSTKEPFKKLVNQGLIMAEDGSKMSKSLGNVVNPDEIVEEYGADTLRCYEMFMGPFEQSKMWNTDAVAGMKKFLDKIWRLFEKPFDTEGKDGNCQMDTDVHVQKMIHSTIKKITEDIDTFKFNTALSQCMIFVNDASKWEKLPKQTMKKFIIAFSPFAPHLCEEIWNAFLGGQGTLEFETWPTYDEQYLVEDTVTYAVQVNGKLRADFEAPADADKESVIATAKEIEKVAKYLAEGEIKKEIFVPGKIVGFVVK